MGMMGGMGGGGGGASEGASAQSLSNMNMVKAGSQFSGSNGGGFSNFVNQYGSAIGSAGSATPQIGDKGGEFTKAGGAWQNARDQVAASNPWAGMFHGIAKMADGVGGAVAGERGEAVVAGFTDPFGGQINALTSKTRPGWQKALGVVAPWVIPMLKDVEADKIKENKEAKMNTLLQTQTEKMRDNRFFKERLASEGSSGSQYQP
jgi:hypothetical protein